MSASTPHPSSSRLCAIALLIASSLLANTLLASDLTIGTDGDDEEAGQRIGVYASWYADNSCRLSIGSAEHVGVTSIDVDMDDAGARTLINCDISNGQRLTLMTRGDGLTLGERRPLALANDIDTAVNTALAWVTRVGEVTERYVPDEIAARRFVVDGHVMIRSTPGVDTVESAPHIDKRAFADVRGQLEPLLRSPPEPPAQSDKTPDLTTNSGNITQPATTREGSRAERATSHIATRRANTRGPGTTH